MANLVSHPHLALVPELTGDAFVALRMSIAADGLIEPVELLPDGITLIGGRARLRACLELGIEPVPTRIVETEDVAGYIVARDMARRDLTTEQRMKMAVALEPLVAAEAERRQRAGVVANLPQGGRTREVLAAISGLSPRTMQKMLNLKRRSPKIYDACDGVKLKLSTALAVAQLDNKKQDAVLARLASGKSIAALLPKKAKRATFEPPVTSCQLVDAIKSAIKQCACLKCASRREPWNAPPIVTFLEEDGTLTIKVKLRRSKIVEVKEVLEDLRDRVRRTPPYKDQSFFDDDGIHHPRGGYWNDRANRVSLGFTLEQQRDVARALRKHSIELSDGEIDCLVSQYLHNGEIDQEMCAA